MAAIAQIFAVALEWFAQNCGHAGNAARSFLPSVAKLHRATATFALNRVSRISSKLVRSFRAWFAEKQCSAHHFRLVMVGTVFALSGACSYAAEQPATNETKRFSIPFSVRNGSAVNAFAVEAQNDLNLTTSSRALQEASQNAAMRKRSACRATSGSIGTTTYLTTHGLNYTPSIMEVGKFSLIDLETQKWVTGRKATSHRERLSERTPKTVMRQSELPYNLILKWESEIRSGFAASNEVVTNCMWYSGPEILNVSSSEVLSAFEYDWKQGAVAITWDGLQSEVQNVGEARVINWVSAKIKNAERTMRNKVTEGMYSDGTGSSGKQIGGLQLLVADDPTTGTVGGVNRANYTYARNKLYDFSVQSVTPSATTIQGAMNTLWLRTSRGMDQPDLILADATYYSYFETSLQAIQRLIDPSKVGRLGFPSLAYKSAEVVYEDSAGMPAAHMYFLDESVSIH